MEQQDSKKTVASVEGVRKKKFSLRLWGLLFVEAWYEALDLISCWRPWKKRPDPRQPHPLQCSYCQQVFQYQCFHAGYGDQDFFYCNNCSNVAVIDYYTDELKEAGKKYNITHREQLPIALVDCSFCGDQFSVDATPRCPKCNHLLRYEEVVDQLSQLTADSAHFKSSTLSKGWHGPYFYVFEGRVIKNPWKTPA